MCFSVLSLLLLYLLLCLAFYRRDCCHPRHQVNSIRICLHQPCVHLTLHAAHKRCAISTTAQHCTCKLPAPQVHACTPSLNACLQTLSPSTLAALLRTQHNLRVL